MNPFLAAAVPWLLAMMRGAPVDVQADVVLEVLLEVRRDLGYTGESSVHAATIDRHTGWNEISSEVSSVQAALRDWQKSKLVAGRFLGWKEKLVSAGDSPVQAASNDRFPGWNEQLGGLGESSVQPAPLDPGWKEELYSCGPSVQDVSNGWLPGRETRVRANLRCRRCRLTGKSRCRWYVALDGRRTSATRMVHQFALLRLTVAILAATLVWQRSMIQVKGPLCCA